LPQAISFFKLRGSWAQAGKDILPWAISSDFRTYSYNGTYTTGSGASLPTYGFASTQIIDPNLKPQRTNEFEVGLNMQFLQNRIGIDVAAFSKVTSEQIASKSLAPESGASSIYMNIGSIRNQGLEISLTGTPVKTKNFSWNSILNFTKYQNKILSYATTNPYVALESQYFTDVRAYVGQAYGDIYSNNSFLPYQAFDANGNKVTDPNNGKHVIFNSGGSWRYEPARYAGAPYDNSARYIGNINPKFLWSWSNTFNYKNFFANFMLDGRVGGKMLSFTYKYGTGIGALTSSLNGRDKEHGGVTYTGPDANGVVGTWNDGVIPDGVFAQGQTTQVNNQTIQLGGMTFKDAVTKGYVNLIPAANYYYGAYGSWSRGIADLSTFDNTWVSVREVNIGYNLPKSIAQKAKMTSDRISLVGRNLFYLFNGMGAHVNPEGIFNNRASTAFDFGAGPSTRSMGVSLNANF
jgi:iron complex outermembrane receptor protein